jgi:signal transduction histidine kinase
MDLRLGLAGALVAYVRHEDPLVRKELAELLDLLPEPAYAQAHAALSRDDHALVCGAAERAAARRGEATSAMEKRVANAQRLLETLERLRRISPEAGRLGELAAKLGSADKAGRAGHEVGRSAQSIGTALVALEKELDKPEPGPETMRRLAVVVRDRYEQLCAVMGREIAPKKRRAKLAYERLRGVVEQARDEVLAVTGKHVDVVIDVDHDLQVKADAPSLRQAIANVLKNAVEAQRGRPGAVTSRARAERDGARVALEIEDRGAGMTKEQVARLFVPFATSKEDGVGVGMVTAQNVIENVHGGVLRVESEKGVGTRVVMRLRGKRGRP